MVDQVRLKDIYAELRTEHPDWTQFQVSTEALRIAEARTYIPAQRSRVVPGVAGDFGVQDIGNEDDVTLKRSGKAKAAGIGAGLALSLGVVAILAARKQLKFHSGGA